jgi:hypothetical protein
LPSVGLPRLNQMLHITLERVSGKARSCTLPDPRLSYLHALKPLTPSGQIRPSHLPHLHLLHMFKTLLPLSLHITLQPRHHNQQRSLHGLLPYPQVPYPSFPPPLWSLQSQSTVLLLERFLLKQITPHIYMFSPGQEHTPRQYVFLGSHARLYYETLLSNPYYTLTSEPCY